MTPEECAREYGHVWRIGNGENWVNRTCAYCNLVQVTKVKWEDNIYQPDLKTKQKKDHSNE